MTTSQMTKLQPITIPLTQEDHAIALKLAQPQPSKDKQKQVYLNVLSVLVVKHYLDILGIKLDFEGSNIYQSFEHLTGDVAALKITDTRLGKQGYLECRHLLKDEANIYIPVEALEERIAYTFVQFDTSYRTGLILGFLPTVSQERVTINQIKPLSELIEFLYEPAVNWLYLRDWLDHKFTNYWLSLEEVIKYPNVSPKLAFRSVPNLRHGINHLLKNLDAKINLNTPINDLSQLIQTTDNEETRWQAVDILRQIEPDHTATGVRRIYPLQEYLDSPVALMIAIVEKANQQMAVLLRVYPIGEKDTLPPQLTLSLFAGTDELLREIVTRSDLLDNYIQLKFITDLGDKFSVMVSLKNKLAKQYFIV